MPQRLVEESAPGVVHAAVTLAMIGGGLCMAGSLGTLLQVVVQPALMNGTIYTGSLISSLHDRPAGTAVVISLAAGIAFTTLLVIAAVMLGRRRRFALGLLTWTGALLILLNFSVGLMIGTMTISATLVAVAAAWLPASRSFLRGKD